MKLYLTKQQAMEKYPLTEAELYDLIAAAGPHDIVLANLNGDRTELIYDDILAAYVADRDITPNKFDHLRGNLLGMSEAGLKYRVTSVTVSRWARQGLLKIHGEDGLKKLVDEADVAYLAKKGRAKKMRPGKKPFYKAARGEDTAIY